MSASYSGLTALLSQRIADECRPFAGRPFLLGLCGCQGSGKSTLALALKAYLERHHQLSSAVLSLDDLYLTKARRSILAATIHPLLMTRGVPGTHDVGLGLRTLNALFRARAVTEVPMPGFDKASDEPRAIQDRESFRGRPGVIIFEGWCVGAAPQSEAALTAPINALERSEDRDGVWRRYANAQLAGPYQKLFGLLDRLVLLQAPGFDVVLSWRAQQEAELTARQAARASPARSMNRNELHRFIMHYERLTRHIIEEMPNRANVTVALGPNREMRHIFQR